MNHRILCTVPLEEFQLTKDKLESFAKVDYLKYPAYGEVEKIIHKYVGLFPNAKMKIDRSLLDKAKLLKIITMPAMGTDHIDKKYCNEKGVEVYSLTDAKEFMSSIPSTAEYTVGLILLLLKKYNLSMNSVIYENKWITSKFRGNDLKNKLVGIIGYGTVGKNVAKLLKAFGSKIYFYDAYVKESDKISKYKSLSEILALSDIITVHVPLNNETKHMLDEEQFFLMKDVLFINASRGGVINETSLLYALDKGNVRAAAVDVLEDESNIDFSSNKMINYSKNNDNLIITPHCAGSSMDGLKKIFYHTAQMLEKKFKELINEE